MKLPAPHLQLIRAALGDAGALEEFRRSHPDWRTLPYLWTRLLPAVGEQHSLRDNEGAVLATLRGTIAGELDRIDTVTQATLSLLEGAGLAPVLLKGQAMRPYYPDPVTRPMGDFDLLLSFESLREASTLLTGQGWKADHAIPQAAHVRHANSYTHPSGVSLDLHWYALESCRWAHVDAALWRGRRGRRLLPSHNFTHVCLHGFLSGWSGVWVVDAARILGQEQLDWSEVLEEARRRRMLPILSRCLAWLKDHFGLPVPQVDSPRLDAFCWCKLNYHNFLARALLPWLEYRRAGGGGLPGFLTYLRQRWELPGRRHLLAEARRRWLRQPAARSSQPQPVGSLDDVREFWSRPSAQEAQDLIHPFHNDAGWAEAVVREIMTPAVLAHSPARALEIGCGMGRVMIPVSRHCAEVIGIDISPQMVEHSRTFLRDHPHIRVLLGDGSQLPIPDRSVQLVYSVICFQHIPDRAVIQSYLREAYRVLSSGGLVRAQTLHTAASPPVSQSYAGNGYTYDSLSSFAADFSQAGFSIVESQEQGPYLWVTGRKV